jgi:hypothetical protein
VRIVFGMYVYVPFVGAFAEIENSFAEIEDSFAEM